MGAICGFVDLKGSLVSVEDLHGMSSTLYHRGPQHESYYFKKGIGIAFRALNIETFYKQNIMETKDDNFFFAVDADFYLKELKNDVSGASKDLDDPGFRLLNDLYKKYGIKFIEKLNGPFSIVILDYLKKMLILGRDRSGQKPLYYTQSNGIFAFSSELKSLTYLPCIDKKLDLESLYWYLAGGSGMSREVHIPFCKGRGESFRYTHLSLKC